MLTSPAGAAKAFAALGNKPGRHAGQVIVRTIAPGDEQTYDTADCLIIDLGLIVSNDEVPYRFVPMGNIAEIRNAPE